MRPDTSSYPEYFHKYISLVKEDSITQAIQSKSIETIQFFESVSESQAQYKYANDKWTIKELLQHVIDTERIFSFRTLAIARMEKIPLPGFDENNYAMNSHANDREWNNLVEEFADVRKSTISLIKSFNEHDYIKSGTINNYQISVLALLFVTVGHVLHHINIIKERYLK